MIIKLYKNIKNIAQKSVISVPNIETFLDYKVNIVGLDVQYSWIPKTWTLDNSSLLLSGTFFDSPSIQVIFLLILPSITWTSWFPLKVRVIGIQLYFKFPLWIFLFIYLFNDYNFIVHKNILDQIQRLTFNLFSVVSLNIDYFIFYIIFTAKLLLSTCSQEWLSNGALGTFWLNSAPSILLL